MWLHSFVIGIGDLAVCVGTDDDDLAAALAPWVVDAPATLVDFGAELHPRETPRGIARTLPNLRRGSNWIASAPAADPVRDGLLRILGALAEQPVPGEFRLAAVPVLRDGAVDLLTVDEVAHGSYRRLSRGGATPLLVDRVSIDPEALTVRIAAPLGSGQPRSWPHCGAGASPTAAASPTHRHLSPRSSLPLPHG